MKKALKTTKEYRVERHLTVFSCVLLTVLILYSLSLIVVFGWGVLSSLKTPAYYNLVDKIGLPEGMPWQWAWSNYAKVFSGFNVYINYKYHFVYDMIVNTLLYAGVGSLLHTSVTCFVAYLVAKFPYKFSKIVFWVVIIVMTIPIVGADISNIQILQNLNIYDTFLGAWVLKFNFMGTYFLVFHAAFEMLPDAYAEAADIDGASEVVIFVKIILPLIGNMFATVFLLNFILFWNDYQVPLLYVPSSPTLSIGVFIMTTSNKQGFANVPMRITSCIIMALPIIVLFVLFRERIMNKVSMGGIKE